MKYILAIITTGIVFLGCKQEAEKNFTVSGTIKNRGATTIYLEETPIATMQKNILDSARLDESGEFELSALTNEQTILNLRLDNDVYPFASMINDVKEIEVNADFSKSKDFYVVEGSPASQKAKEYLAVSGEMIRDIFYLKQRNDSLNGTGEEVNRLSHMADSAQNYTITQINQSANPALAMFILSTYQGIANDPAFGLNPIDNEQLSELLVKINSKFPDHQGVASIRKYFEERVPKSAWIGKQAPNFTLPDTEGGAVSLSQFRGRYVLVDFWASWCVPCRDENPNVVNAYNKFKSKNFTVLGVSLDRSRDAWLKAISDDRLNWTHVSDLRQWQSMVVPLYSIQGIPFNVLVDPDGKIVAENLRGDGLERALVRELN